MRVPELIDKKRDGYELTDAEIDYIIHGLINGEVKDYQMSAFMMAVVFQGMSSRETAALTMAMMHSGEVVDLSDLPGVKVDKHSTGGVGDTTTLVTAPLVAACGGTVAKMSGRGLAHSGGTLDKLESVPHVCIEKSMADFKQIVRSVGVAVIGQSDKLVPADKIMYSLRDVTGTIPSIPLIASSIMSKKLAAGADAIVLDVKVGKGAFIHTLDDARRLAWEMVQIGDHVGRKTIAIITDMNRPLGMAIGNGLEMKEAIDVLCNRIDINDPLVQVCMTLGSHMLVLSNIANNIETARAMLKDALVSGRGYRKLRDMLIAMGAEEQYVDEPDLLVKVNHCIPVFPPKSGYIGELDAHKIGLAACVLGAGRERKDDIIDPAVGILMNKRYGDYVAIDEPYAVLYANDEKRIETAMQLLSEAVELNDNPPKPLPMIYDIIK